jgi:hypothetical protein
MFVLAIFYRLQLFFFGFAISAAGLVAAGMMAAMLDDPAPNVADGAEADPRQVIASD